MQPLAVTSYTLVSPLGRGRAATWAALASERSGLRPYDLEWAPGGGWIGRVDGIESEALPHNLSAFDCRNNRLAKMGLKADNFDQSVADAVSRYGADRVALVLGTSTSGLQSGEAAYRARSPITGALPDEFNFNETQDYYALADFVHRYLGLRGPAFVVSTACSSSAKAFVDGAQLIESGMADAVVVGGVDSLCLMTLRGFASLELISPEPCRPNDVARKGLNIGEAAGFAILERADRAAGRSIQLLGYGESSDAYHMSSPHPEGLGAQRAMRAALARAELEASRVDYINLHGTGTPINDRIEDAAVLAVFGDTTPVSSTKGWTGHALGSAGIVEAALSFIAIEQGFLPRNLNLETLDPTFRSNVLRESRRADIDVVMSNSFGFGGNNCSLVFGRPS
ncbi:MAG: beta-ketoacyl-[acyl-carrier-protein] synthase family protein [Alphaproteobacteria bacterium]